jgi:hypothetical protein
MIENQEDYEAALERLLGHLDGPLPGGPEHAEFTRLLAEIESFDPPSSGDAEAPHGLRERAKDLAARATDFLRRHDEQEQSEKLMSFPEDGEGIGPTTGV